MLQAIWHHCNRHGYAGREVSLDTVLPSKNDSEEPITLFDKIEHEWANEDQNDRSDEHLQRIIWLIKELIDTHPSLTPRERKILRFRLRGWDNRRIQRRVHGSVGTEAASAVRKLRAAMRDLGYHALMPSAKVPTVGFGRPAPERPCR